MTINTMQAKIASVVIIAHSTVLLSSHRHHSFHDKFDERSKENCSFHQYMDMMKGATATVFRCSSEGLRPASYSTPNDRICQ